MIILEAEASLAVAEALADDITSGVLTPPLGMSSGDSIGLGPTYGFRFCVEKSRPFVPISGATLSRSAAGTSR